MLMSQKESSFNNL